MIGKDISEIVKVKNLGMNTDEDASCWESDIMELEE